jgi:hypothetical protein
MRDPRDIGSLSFPARFLRLDLQPGADRDRATS